MATHDYNIANQIGSEFRADLNNALLAIVSNNSNATSPSTTYAYQLWVDTANNVLKLRNSANNAWITTGISITASNSFTGDITGNSATTTALATARTINGVSFDGTANISFNTDSVSEGSSNKYFTNERVDDQVNSLLTAGSGISLTYDDAAGTLTIANTNSADITSVVAGDGLTGGGTSGDVTLAVGVDDSSIEINSDALRVKASGVTNAMLAGSIANSKLANSSVTINSQAISLGGSHTFDSDDIGEGSSNLYFTNARARGSLSIGSEGSASGNGAIAYNSSTGVFTYTPPVISGLTGDTDDLSEGSSNLYYTDARANAAIDARVTNTFINNLSGVVADTATALATARSIALSGDVTASGVNFDGTGDITLSTTIAANSVALGTDTTGNYVATVAGTTNEIEVSGSGSETASVTIGLPDNVTIAGNLTVNGTTTTVNTATLEVEDPLIKLAKANSGADSVDIGFYGLYDTSGSQDLYAGLFRDASDSGKFKLFKDLQAEPTTTVNTSGTGYAVGTLVSNLEGDVTGNVTGNVSGTAATVTGAAQTNITSLGTLTTLTVDDITINGSTISDSGDFTLDVGGDIILDAGGDDITFKSGGTEFGGIFKNSNDMFINSAISDGDIKFRGNDGGSFIIPLTLDMSDAGKAIFTAGATFGNNVDITGTLAATLSTAAQPNITSLGTLTTLTVDDITINGSTISDSGDFTLDVGGDITLDAAGGQVRFKNNGTTNVTFNIDNTPEVLLEGGNAFIGTTTSDADLTIFGSDGGSNINALVFDMSDAGAATFNSGITFGDGHTIGDDADDNLAIASSANENIIIDSSDDIILDAGGGDWKFKDDGVDIGLIANSSSDLIIQSIVSDKDMLFRGNDGGSTIVALTLDMSDAGFATFNSGVTISGDSSINRGNQTSGELLIGGTTDGGFVDFDGSSLQLNTQRDPNTGTFINTSKSNARIELVGNDADAHIKFRTTASNNTSASQRMIIDKNGNVGINETAPNAKLDVAVSGSGTQTAMILNNSHGYGSGVGTAASALQFRRDSGGSGEDTPSAQIHSGNESETTSNPSNLVFSTKNNSGTLTEALRINSSQNLILNTATVATANAAADDFVIKGSGTAVGMTISQDSDSGTGTIFFGDTSSSSAAGFRYNHNTGDMAISAEDNITISNDSSETARATEDNHFLIGTTTNQGVGGISFQHASSGVNIQQNSDSTSGGYEFYVFRRNSTQIGSINQSSTNAVTYNTSSDARLKDITGSSRGLDVINNLNPVAYNWKSDNHADEGLIAQEVEKLVPNAVNQDEDGYYSMDYSKLVTHLVKGMQEQQEQIESLKSEIANLKGE
jgi:hypothetical protein